MTWVLRCSFSTSFRSAIELSWGHSSSSSRKYSGPCFHLPISRCAGIPWETSSATFNSPGTCLHWDGSELLWISATRADTNGLNSLAWLWIHDNTMLLSETNTTFSNCSLDSSDMDWYSLVASTAACSSRRGMLSGFSGATLDLAAMNHVSYSLLSVHHLT